MLKHGPSLKVVEFDALNIILLQQSPGKSHDDDILPKLLCSCELRDQNKSMQKANWRSLAVVPTKNARNSWWLRRWIPRYCEMLINKDIWLPTSGQGSHHFSHLMRQQGVMVVEWLVPLPANHAVIISLHIVAELTNKMSSTPSVARAYVHYHHHVLYR